ncbi:MAG: 2-amino-4-hydroxy-6-hydroxymethyldihydropteridine diphosphokinase [Candidatus Omnitrophica bacterium]|nr:2-amino-4-hydroxy-6-hydroxymethyldihydropteridine diphosphokinase [Candidatus Omnitrophota bacterium]MBU4468407.1 2-amino-4-hydroxy-6-hydroxymethyldihydropteridine diphosphokinase [Candidatus Omnitrophota bacterium]MCG2708400.1 2-amino-4-hydroxy-6-hydroxymethyldihydropteridine diphosphokinase [Candidatus Omnitrophota bacterium]
MVICYLGVGSNLGNRRRNIKLAVKKISALKDTEIIKESKLFEFLPSGGPAGQPNYLNAALRIKTNLSPLNLLKKLKKIENDLGRIPTVRFGPRIIDLDILLYGDRVIRNKALTIPHPRMFNRDFVIKPLTEVL